MKCKILIFIYMVFFLVAEGQVSKTINLSTAGTLTSSLTSTEKSTITNLTITGNIDARDIKCMRDEIIKLAVLDLSGSTVKAYTGASGSVNGVLTTYPANEMPVYSFYNSKSSPSVSKISLKSVALPLSLTSIGTYAFYNCTGLYGPLAIPSSVTSIGSYSFALCSGIKQKLTLPSTVTSVGSNAFWNCSGLYGTLTLSTSLTSIEDGAFSGCSGFTGVLTIPTSVVTIGEAAFIDCSGFSGDLTFPSSVLSIGASAFANCIGFKGNLNIPSSVTSIGSAAFLGCTGFSGNLSLPSSIKTLGNSTFSGCTGFSGNLILPVSLESIGSNVFDGCNGLSGNLNLPNSIKSIGDYAFYLCTGFTGSLIIPSTVTSIGNYAFSDLRGLNGSLTIPNSVVSIGQYAFANLFNGITSIYLSNPNPATVSLGSNVFSSINRLNCILYVPIGSKNVYQKAAQWSSFSTIVEKSFTSNLELPICSIEIHQNSLQNSFVISGLEENASFELSNIGGSIILKKTVSNDECISIDSVPSGIYIITIRTNYGHRSMRIIKN